MNRPEKRWCLKRWCLKRWCLKRWQRDLKNVLDQPIEGAAIDGHF